MNEKFEVGEVAIFWRPGTPNHGCELAIVGPLQFVEARSHFGGTIERAQMYQVEPCGDWVKGPYHVPGNRLWARPCHLRKQQPPREDLGITRWSECPWQPERISA